MRHTNDYLYGTDDVPDFPEDILMRRMELLKEHLEELMDIDWNQRDGTRCNAVIKALRFHEDINKKDN